MILLRTKKDFNPRSRKGNDLERVRTKKMRIDFNPRSRKGNDADCNYFTECF